MIHSEFCSVVVGYVLAWCIPSCFWEIGLPQKFVITWVNYSTTTTTCIVDIATAAISWFFFFTSVLICPSIEAYKVALQFWQRLRRKMCKIENINQSLLKSFRKTWNFSQNLYFFFWLGKEIDWNSSWLCISIHRVT